MFCKWHSGVQVVDIFGIVQKDELMCDPDLASLAIDLEDP